MNFNQIFTPSLYTLVKKALRLHNSENDGAKSSPRLFLEMSLHACQRSSPKRVCVYEVVLYEKVYLCRAHLGVYKTSLRWLSGATIEREHELPEVYNCLGRQLGGSMSSLRSIIVWGGNWEGAWALLNNFSIIWPWFHIIPITEVMYCNHYINSVISIGETSQMV